MITTFSPAPGPVTEQNQRFSTLYENPNLQYSVYRHVMVLDTTHRRFTAYIPREILNQKSLSCDPLPPPRPISLYDEEYFAGVDDSFGRASRRDNERMLARLIPNADFRAQLEVSARTLFNRIHMLN